MIIIRQGNSIVNLGGIKIMKEIDLVVIGNLAFSREITSTAEKVCLGGGAYDAAIGASVVSEKIGLVSHIGPDFPLEPLQRRTINIEGVKIIPDGKTPVFTVY